jgi:hypothetical protein
VLEFTYNQTYEVYRERWEQASERKSLQWVGLLEDEERKCMKPRKYTKWKVVLGAILLILTPLRLFTVPETAKHIEYDLALVIGGIRSVAALVRWTQCPKIGVISKRPTTEILGFAWDVS